MWWQIAINLAIAAISYLMYKPPAGPKSLKAKDVSVPKSEEGDSIYDGAGTFWVDDAHVVWHGDFDSKAIYSKSGKK
jgi:hypothetical protein